MHDLLSNGCSDVNGCPSERELIKTSQLSLSSVITTSSSKKVHLLLPLTSKFSHICYIGQKYWHPPFFRREKGTSKTVATKMDFKCICFHLCSHSFGSAFFSSKEGGCQYFCPYSVCTSHWCLVMSFWLSAEQSNSSINFETQSTIFINLALHRVLTTRDATESIKYHSQSEESVGGLSLEAHCSRHSQS